MWLIFLLLLLFVANPVATFKAPVCTGITYTSVLRNCTTDEIFFIQGFNLDVKLSSNLTHPNRLKFSNMTTWSLNEKKYFQGSPLYWQYLNTLFTNPNLNNEPFEIDFFDASGTYGLQVWINQTYFLYRTVLYAFLPMVINKGRIFENDYGLLFDPINNPCFDSVFGDLCLDQPTDSTFISKTTACCKNYVDFEYPENNQGFCTEFLTKANVTDSDGISIVHFEAFYWIYKDKMEIRVSNFSSIYNDSIYYHIPNFIAGDFCNGDVNHPFSGCSSDFPDGDFQYNMVLEVYSEGNIDDNFLPVISQIIRRNGNLYHSDNIPYTPSNPCFKKTTYDSFDAGLTAKGSSCCKKFGEAVYAPTTPPPITPTKPSDFCVKYYSKTNLSDNSAALNVEYQITGQNPKHRINVWVEYFAKEFSELQFEAYSTDTFSYSCIATTETPKANCTLKFSDTHKYILEMRTSLMPDGFNMLTLIEENGQFITPVLTPSNPCHFETNPYNYPTSNVLATTKFCCSIFG